MNSQPKGYELSLSKETANTALGTKPKMKYGKSMLCSVLYRHIRSNSSTAALCFMFSEVCLEKISRGAAIFESHAHMAFSGHSFA